MVVFIKLVLFFTSVILVVPWAIKSEVNGLGGKVVLSLPKSFDNQTQVSLLHISRHAGCIRDTYTTTALLGIYSEVLHFRGPYTISKEYADEDWRQNKEYYNQFDYVLTSDTTCISRIFLQHINELKGRLIIYISNRFDNGVENDLHYRQLFMTVAVKRPEKITLVPFCDFETAYALSRGVDFRHFRSIPPLGDWTPISNEGLKLDWEEEVYGPAGDRWAGRSVSKSLEMFDTLYLNHYPNEQDNGMIQKCKENGIKCFLGYAESVAAFKAMVVLPFIPCQIAPYDTIARGIVALVPTPRFLLELASRVVPGFGSYMYMDGGLGLVNGTSFCVWTTQFKECRIQFDSGKEMLELMKNVTAAELNKKRNNCITAASLHRIGVLNAWRKIFQQSFTKI